MSTIRDLPNRPSLQPLPVEQTGTQDTTPPRVKDGPVDTASRVSSTKESPLESPLKAPPLPPNATNLEDISGAQSFVLQLEDMGGLGGRGSDAMLLAFLKLQILDASLDNLNQALIGAGRSCLLNSAHRSQKDSSAFVADLQDQARTHQSSAQASRNRADNTVREAGVDPAEVERLYNQSVAAGKGGSDVVERYQTSRPEGYDPAKLQREVNALRRAEPDYRSAVASSEAADDAWAGASNASGQSVLAIHATHSVRAGAVGYGAMLRSAEMMQNQANELMALLAGMRPDALGREQSRLDMNRARIETAKLLLNILDQLSTADRARHRSGIS